MIDEVFDFYAVNNVSKPSELFNTFTDTFYFAKNIQGKFVFANQLLYEHFDLGDPNDVIGKADSDFFRRDIADQIHSDDLLVMSGLQIKNKLELIEDGQGDVHWFCTSKMPLRNHTGQVVGVEGISRDVRRANESIEPYNVFRACISFMQKNYKKTLYMEKLAEISCMSLSTFERQFKKHFGYTPKQHIKRLKVKESCRLLVAGYTLQYTYQECGFCDQSYFTREFRRVMGMTPRVFQQRYTKKGEI